MVEEKAQNGACGDGSCKWKCMNSDDMDEAEKASGEGGSEKKEDSASYSGEKGSLDTEIVPRKRIEELEGQIAILKEAVVRNLAETENLRKRLEKEKSDAVKYANGKFAKDLLGVADNFDRVMQHIKSLGDKFNSDAVLKPIIEGVELCGKELLSVFRKHGIDRVDVSEGTNFDPNYHQAMCEVESDKHNPGSVIDIMQSGYTYNSRLLRPAMVSVAKKSS